MHDGFHVVAGEEPREAVADPLEPAIVVLLDHVDDGPLDEAQLVVLVPGVVVDGHHCEQKTEGERAMFRGLRGLAAKAAPGRLDSANLSRRSSWAPTAGLRRRRGRCTAPRRRPPLRSRRGAAVGAEATRRTSACRPEVAGVAESGYRQLFGQTIR